VVVAYPTDRAEADGIARAARDAKGPHGRWSDQAVLVRTHAQIPLLEEALRRARIPYRTRAGSGLLEQPEVRSVLWSLTRERGDLRTALADLEQSAGHAGPPVHDPLETGDEPPAMDDRDANVAAVVALGYEYLSVEPSGTAAGFVQWLRATVARDPADSIADAVELVTFHAAKGLEWPVVHVAGLEHGLVPISRARTPEALAEAMTQMRDVPLFTLDDVNTTRRLLVRARADLGSRTIYAFMPTAVTTAWVESAKFRPPPPRP